MSSQHERLLLLLEAPDPRGSIHAAGDQPPAIGREGCARSRRSMSAQVRRLRTANRVPDARAARRAGAHQSAAGRIEDQVRHPLAISGETCQLAASPVWPRMTASCLPVPASHTRAVRSALLVSARVPSGLNAALESAPVWP